MTDHVPCMTYEQLPVFELAGKALPVLSAFVGDRLEGLDTAEQRRELASVLDVLAALLRDEVQGGVAREIAEIAATLGTLGYGELQQTLMACARALDPKKGYPAE